MSSAHLTKTNRLRPVVARALTGVPYAWAMAEVAGNPQNGFVTTTSHHRRLPEVPT